MCQCFQIGGPFIAEDPDCPVHGQSAQAERKTRDELIAHCDLMQAHGTPSEITAAYAMMLDYLKAL